MKRTPFAGHPCSIARSLDVVGEWWTPLILRDVSYGVRRFAELQGDLGISANVLSDRLQALVDDGILQTAVYQEKPERREYLLTEKGLDLLPALLALMSWGDRWAWGEGEGPVGVCHRECGHEVTVEIRCPHCDREAQPSELRATLRKPVDPVTEDLPESYPGHLSGARLARAGGVGLGGQPG